MTFSIHARFPEHSSHLSQQILRLAAINLLTHMPDDAYSTCSRIAVVDRDGKKAGDVVDEDWEFSARRTHEEIVAVEVEAMFSK